VQVQEIQQFKTPVFIFFFGVLLLCCSFSVRAASDPIRIVVLPFYNESGLDTNDDGETSIHYRRIIRFINNQLVRHDFEVINPFASDASAKEYDRIQERARVDSSLASLEMCKKYQTDAVYMIWLKVKPWKMANGYCKAKARLEGEGYDSAGHDLGVGLSKTFTKSRRTCDDAIIEAEKEVGDHVGRILTAYGDRNQKNSNGGALARNIKKNAPFITVRLGGSTDFQVTEVFGKVVNSATGVIGAKRYASQMIPDNPQASYVTWRATIEGTDPFKLQTNILKMIQDISDAGGTIQIKGIPYRYSAFEIEMLKGIRPADATSREIQFVIDRDLARKKEFTEK
jgi:hypothetical protein